MEGIPDEVIPRMQHRISRIIRDNEERMRGSNGNPADRLEGRSGGVSNGTEEANHHSSPTLQNTSLINQSSIRNNRAWDKPHWL